MKTTKLLLKTSVLAMLLSTPALARDTLIGADNPEGILKIAQEFGNAELTVDSYGDPMIEAEMNDTTYRIVFYDCDMDGSDCGAINFGAMWYNENNVSLRDINNWNSTERYGQAYLDSDKDPNLDFEVNLEHGVTVRNLEATFENWETALMTFESEMLGY
uniref:YbjN domain-containing protein n=1 Tax=Thaumasiovibrio occultus TaxID=1891184 RepID=UPI000B34DE48|nr:YbjN domain-containing protein [Thaumasiovibrio occultus]